MRFTIESNIDEVAKKAARFTELFDELAQDLAEESAIEAVDLIKNEIRTGVYDTLSPETKVIGLVDSGTFLESIDYELFQKGDQVTAVVGSSDPKAEALEYGTDPKDHSDLRVEELISWAQSKGIPRAQYVGKSVWSKIRSMGTVPKAPFRKAMGSIKATRNNVINKVRIKFNENKKRL